MRLRAWARDDDRFVLLGNWCHVFFIYRQRLLRMRRGQYFFNRKVYREEGIEGTGSAARSGFFGPASGEGGAHFLPDLNEGQHGQQQVPPPPDVIPYEYTEHTPAVEGGGRDVREVDDDDECFDFEL